MISFLIDEVQIVLPGDERGFVRELYARDLIDQSPESRAKSLL